MNIENIRSHFAQLSSQVRGHPLIYFDNAATTLKPRVVTETMEKYNSMSAANIHRGAHYFGNEGTEKYEAVRTHVAQFINARSNREIIFTKGTTESLNLIAQSYVRKFLKPGDEILLTEVEHHSNIVPWQIIAQEKDLIIRVLPILDNGQWDLSRAPISEKTKLVSAAHISNVTGLIYPIEQLIAAAKKVGAVTVVDAAQSIAALKTDVQKLDCDFLAFSGHKIFGPFGVGVLYGREALLNQMPPYQSGGSMIADVSFGGTTYLNAPYRFEAGTPNISGVLGLGAALDFVDQQKLESLCDYKHHLGKKFEEAIQSEEVNIYGSGGEKTSVTSFSVPGVHPSDAAHILDQQGIAVRAGHLCAQPLMTRFGVSGLMRASLSIYNTEDEIFKFIRAFKKSREMFL